ncbi:MAG: dihydropteroate synthase [Candidatus Hydrogenedentes bacterium]|nr:dihydropteroate synthase [Candidatus Hydrogenedentota bacterium]
MPQQATCPPVPVPTPGQGKTLIIGVLNVTPDSFCDGGRYPTLRHLRDAAEAMIAHGAHILDIGGESSRPGAYPVSPEEERHRVLPAIEALRDLGVALSVDTWRAATARAALEAGAAMINDITGLRGDPEMAGVIAEAGCPAVVMHMQGLPQTMQAAPHYHDVVGEVAGFFEERIAALTDQGVKREQLWLDPGFGFGKTVAHNLELLRRLAEFRRFGLPLLLGTSNKSTIGAVLGLPVEDRLEGTAATVAIGICNGADAVRVHDVKAMARVAAMSDAILHGWNAG